MPARLWNACWIWPRDRTDPNLHLLFRRDLTVETLPAVARLFIAAESQARIFLNGVEVGATAPNSYPGQHYYEEFDVRPALVAGVNRLAVVARYLGIPSSASCPKDPGLIAELVLDGTSIGSDATWLCRPLEAWLGRQRRSEWLNLDIIEMVDRRLLPPGYPCVADLAGFTAPEALRWPGVRFTGLEPRPFPKTVVAGDARLALLKAGVAADRSGEHPIPAIAMSHEEIVAQPFAWDGGPCTIPALPPGQAFALLFQLDSYWNGRVLLDLDGPAGAVVDLAWHETLLDGRLDVRHTRVYTADRHILAAGANRIEPEDWQCGRFIQLTFRNLTAPVRLHGLRFRREEYPLTQRLTFTASDQRLERIVAISLAAARRCMHDNIMDCPWRERRQWIGDVQRIGMTSHLAFTDRQLVRGVLRQHTQLQHPSGRMWVCVPIWEEMPPQSMEWVRAILDYQHASGDRTLLPEVFDNIELLHRWFLRHRDSDGLLRITQRPVIAWMDNPFGRLRKHQFETAFLGLNLRYLIFLDDVATCCRAMGRETEASAAQAERARLAARIRPVFLDPASGLLRDCARADLPLTHSELGHALAIQTGIYQGDEGLALWRRLCAFRAARRADTIIASPFGSYHVLRALHQLGQDDAMLEYILAKWGPMVDAGAETTWEHFLDEGHAGDVCTHGSVCHGWASTPVVALCQMLLGLDPAKPGQARRENVGGVAWFAATLT